MKHTLCRTTVNRSVGIVTTLLMLLGFVQSAQGQISLSGTYTQNFDGIGLTATAAMPANIKIGNSTSLTYATAGSNTTQIGGSSTAASTGGLYNWANGVAASGTDRAVGWLSSGSYAQPGYLYVYVRNATGSTIKGFALSFDYEKYRSGSVTASMQLQGSTDGVTFTNIGGGGDLSFPADANATTAMYSVTNKTAFVYNLSIANGSDYYFRWVFSESSSTNSQGIGIDNISITPVTAESHFYSKSTGALDAAGSWGIAADGSSTAPSNFTTAGQIFHVSNGNSGSITTSPWTISGGKVAVDGTDLTISSSKAISGVLSIYNGRTVSLLNTSIPAFDSLKTGSTLYVNNSTTNTLPMINYGNLILDGATTTINLIPSSGNAITISGNLTANSGFGTTLSVPSGTTLNLGGNYTWLPSSSFTSSAVGFNFNGSSAQTYSTNVTAGHTFSVTTLNNAAGLTLGGNLTSTAFAWTSGNITAIGGTTTLVGSSLSVTTLSGAGAKTFLGGGTWNGSTGINGGVLKITGISPSTLTGGITVGSSSSTYNSGVLDLSAAGAWPSTAGNITINPYSQLYLGAAATLSGVTVTLNGSGNNITTTYGLGALKSAVTVTSPAAYTIASSSTVAVNASTTLTMSGIVTYTGELTKRGTGGLVISGTSNTGAGGFTLAEGNATISGAGGAGSGTVKFNPAVVGAATLTLGASNTITGLSTTWLNGTISGVQTLQLPTTTTLTLNNSSDNTFGVNPGNAAGTSVLNGAGNFVKSGSGSLLLTNGGHNVTGAITVSGGTISLTSSVATTLGTTGGITVNSGSLQISNGAVTSLGALAIATGTTVSISGSAVRTTTINQAGGSTVITGATTTIAGTTISVSGGSLAMSGTTSISGGATTISGGTVSLTSGTTTSLTSLTVSGSGAAILNNVGTATTGAISATGGSVTKLGAGGMTTASLTINGATVTLANSATGTNTITSGTSITNGALVLAPTGASVTVTGAQAINTSGILQLVPATGATTLTFGATTLNGGAIATSGISASGVIINGGSFTLAASGTITLDGSVSHAIRFANSGSNTWAGSTLTIYGWQGNYTGGSGTAGQIFFGVSNATGTLGTTNLAKIVFSDGTNTYPAIQLSTGEIVPKASITTGAIAGSPFYNDVDNVVNVPYTYTGPISGTVSVEMSDATGSFASPTVLATAAIGGGGSGTVTAVTIPSLTAVGVYSVRVTASTPITVNGSSVSIIVAARAPIVTSLSSYNNVVPGSTLTITGTNFNTVTARNKVFFGQSEATILSGSFTELVVTVPKGLSVDLVTVVDTQTKQIGQSSEPINADFTTSYLTSASLMNTQAGEDFDMSSGTAWNTAVADFNGDGKLDIAALTGDPNKSIKVFLNTGADGSVDISSSTFTLDYTISSGSISGSDPSNIKAADMDNDGMPDILIATGGGAQVLNIFRNNTVGYGAATSVSFEAKQDIALGGDIRSPKVMTIADFDKDGKLDIAAACYGVASKVSPFTGIDTVVFFRNTSTVRHSFNSSSFTSFALAGGATDGTNNAPKGVTITSICSGDFDNDGDIDVAMVNPNSNGASIISVFPNNSTINTVSFGSASSIYTSANATDLAAADLDNDGDVDLAVVNQYSHTISVFNNNGGAFPCLSVSPSATITCTLTSGMAAYPSAIALGDMNGDGKVDIINSNVGNLLATPSAPGTEALSIFTNTSATNAPSFNATPTRMSATATGSVVAGIIVQDIDKDRFPDIILSNGNSASFTIFRKKPTVAMGTLNSSSDILCHGSTVTLSYDGTTATPSYSSTPLPSDLSYTWSVSDEFNGSIDPVTGVFTGTGAGAIDAVYSLSVTGTNITSTLNKGLTIRYVNVTPGTTPVACEGATSAELNYSDTFGPPTHYSLTFDGVALGEGFADVTNAILPASPITITVPGAAPYDIYNAVLTVSNAFCTSDPMAINVQLSPKPVASILASTTSLCANRDAYVVLNGTTGVNNVTYTVNGVSNMVDLADGTDTIFIPRVADTTVYKLVSAYDGYCQSDYTDDSVKINTIPEVWLGTTNDWQTASNWGCAVVPTDSDIVIIPVTANDPVIGSSATGTSATLTILSGASVTIGSSSVLSVKEGLDNSGNIYGAGKIALNGTAAESISGIGYVNNVELNNAAGATINTGSRMIVKGTVTMTSGTLATNDSLELYSDVMGTARVAEISGSAAISGNVKTDQYIQANYRRYRFWSHPFSTSISLKQLQTYMDITGTGGNTNGFTTTGTNAPSAFRFDPLTSNSAASSDPGWKAFTKINGTEADTNKLNRYQGIRLFMRGAKGEGLNGWPYVPSANTLAMRGPLNQGDQIIPIVRGTTTPTQQDYNMLGNPYASPVNIRQALTEALDSGYVVGAAAYVWNASLAFAGQYQAVPIGAATADYYLPAYASFQVRAATNTGSHVRFTESMKGATANAYLFRPSSSEYVALNVYDANDHLWDMLTIRFDNNATDGEDLKLDAVKLMSTDFSMYSVSSDKRKMTIDTRPFAEGKVIPLGITSNFKQQFKFRADNMVLPAGTTLYLHDKLAGTYQELTSGMEYNFNITDEAATQGDNRFELSLKPAAVAAKFSVSIMPNPASDVVRVSFTAKEAGKATVRVTDMLGAVVYTNDLGTVSNGTVAIPVAKLAAGAYMVEVTAGADKSVQKLIKE